MASPPSPLPDLVLSLPDDPSPGGDETRVLPIGASSSPPAPAPQAALHFEPDEATLIKPIPARAPPPAAIPEPARLAPAADLDDGPTLIRLSPLRVRGQVLSLAPRPRRREADQLPH